MPALHAGHSWLLACALCCLKHGNTISRVLTETHVMNQCLMHGSNERVHRPKAPQRSLAPLIRPWLCITAVGTTASFESCDGVTGQASKRSVISYQATWTCLDAHQTMHQAFTRTRTERFWEGLRPLACLHGRVLPLSLECLLYCHFRRIDLWLS
jgi:hypothetical protein